MNMRSENLISPAILAKEHTFGHEFERIIFLLPKKRIFYLIFTHRSVSFLHSVRRNGYLLLPQIQQWHQAVLLALLSGDETHWRLCP